MNVINQISAKSLYNEEIKLVEYEVVEKCPNCNCVWQPKIINAIFDTYNHKNSFEQGAILHIFYICTNCHRGIVGTFKFQSHNKTFKLINLVPKYIDKKEFNQEIAKISPNFIKIYRESEIAESMGLIEVAGVGYRKSLEFLIKDYAIANNPNDKSKIEIIPLAKCISEYIKTPNIKSLLERCTWLGNDQTHYVKKHIGKDINDLKSLFDISISYIQMELLSQKAIKEIQPVKK